MYIYRVGVAGAGTMGAQIAQVVSFAGIPVVLADVGPALARRGVETVRRLYQGRVDKGKMTPEQLEEKMLLVAAAESLDGMRDADLVVEAAPENLPLKQRLFAELDRICGPSAILASNTSALSISALGAATSRPGRVIGLHFFNPAYAMPLVEVVPGLATDPGVVQDVVGFAESLRKTPVVVKECAGFLVNRLLMPYLNETILCVQEGAAAPAAIDQAMTGFGLPVGPLTLLDTVGLDVALEVARVLHRHYGPRMAPAALLEALVKAGRTGVEAGRGFYAYAGDDDPELPQLIDRLGKETGRRGTAWTPERLLLPMVNEAALALDEGVASADAIDLAMRAGAGFPADKHGPLHYADELGLDRVVQELEGLVALHGPRFWPAPILRRYVGAGYTGRGAGRGIFRY